MQNVKTDPLKVMPVEGDAVSGANDCRYRLVNNGIGYYNNNLSVSISSLVLIIFSP